jgi:hypothetical protein
VNPLIYVVARVEEHLEEPVPHDPIHTFCESAVLLCVCKRATEGQPQKTVNKLLLQVGEHVAVGALVIVFLIELLDRVRQLG